MKPVRRRQRADAAAAPPMHLWVTRPPQPDVREALNRLARADDVQYIAVMPDVHRAADVCVGCVVATQQLVYPEAVGGDIGCGMLAAAFDADADALDDARVAAQLFAELRAAVPAQRHARRALVEDLPAALAPAALTAPALATAARRLGVVELGTLGRGNHFLELQADGDSRLWATIHSGSRGMGQAISDWHLRHATRGRSGLHYLDAQSDLGRAYLADVEWARRYAFENRRRMLVAVAAVLRRVCGVSLAAGAGRALEQPAAPPDVQPTIDPAAPLTHVALDHNHVASEAHLGHTWWVHRKGASPAADGRPGVIPGSMGTQTLLVTGRGCERALRSSAHGAGRVLTRTEARQSLAARDVAEQTRGVWLDPAMLPRLVEEAPSVYRDIGAVMRAQRELVRIVGRLRPLLCYKGV